MSEALKQLRTLLTTLLTVSLLWLVTVQTVGDSLARRQHAKEVLAWLSVRDSLVEGADQLAEQTVDPITCFIRMVPIQSGTEVEECNPIVADIPLMEHSTGTLTLTPLPEIVGVYRVSSTVNKLDLSSYYVASIRNKIWVIPSELALKNFRDFNNAALRDGLASPRHWPALKAELLSTGWSGNKAADLKINDSAVSKFIAQALTATFSVASIPVSAPFYPAALAAFIALIGFMMIGPILKIRAGSEIPDGEPWVLVARASGRIGTALTGTKIAIALLYVALPVIVYATQFLLWPLLGTAEKWLWLFSSTLMLVTPIIVLYAATSLWQLHTRHSFSVNQA